MISKSRLEERGRDANVGMLKKPFWQEKKLRWERAGLLPGQNDNQCGIEVWERGSGEETHRPQQKVKILIQMFQKIFLWRRDTFNAHPQHT